MAAATGASKRVKKETGKELMDIEETWGSLAVIDATHNYHEYGGVLCRLNKQVFRAIYRRVEPCPRLTLERCGTLIKLMDSFPNSVLIQHLVCELLQHYVTWTGQALGVFLEGDLHRAILDAMHRHDEEDLVQYNALVVMSKLIKHGLLVPLVEAGFIEVLVKLHMNFGHISRYSDITQSLFEKIGDAGPEICTRLTAAYIAEGGKVRGTFFIY